MRLKNLPAATVSRRHNRRMLTTPKPLISELDMPHIDRVFESDGGYVLDFTNATFGAFFAEEVGVNINADEFHADGSSKGRRLRCFLRTADARTVVKALRDLLAYRTELHEFTNPVYTLEQVRSFGKVQKIIERLEQASPSTDGIDRFSADETLDELVASIERDINADKPQVALDRLHTYCMKKFAHLLRVNGLESVAGETLNARAGRYFNPLRRRGVRPITDKIMKTTVEAFELFNAVRNNESLAHDNVLIEPAEARYIFEAVTNLLRFVKSVEGRDYELGTVGTPRDKVREG